jgi:hypothetical protein
MSELIVGDIGQVRALEEELKHQAVGGLVGAALPNAVGVSEEDLQRGFDL